MSPLLDEKHQNRPLSYLNTGALLAMLPVTILTLTLVTTAPDYLFIARQ